MKLLEDRIRLEGRVLPGNVLKVDGFLNHRLDIALLDKLGEEFYRLFSDAGVTKILTVEASGIALASLAARYFKVPVVFAKKHKTSNMSREVYSAEVFSFTHNCVYNVAISSHFMDQGDRVLIIDDFLADGNAIKGLASICKQAGAEVVGAGIAVEKGFQGGGDRLREAGLRVESLAVVESMDPEKGIVFR